MDRGLGIRVSVLLVLRGEDRIGSQHIDWQQPRGAPGRERAAPHPLRPYPRLKGPWVGPRRKARMEYVHFAGHGDATSRGRSSSAHVAARRHRSLRSRWRRAPRRGSKAGSSRVRASSGWAWCMGLAIYGSRLAGLLLIPSYATAAVLGDAARQAFVALGGLLLGLVALVLPLSIYFYRRRKAHRQSQRLRPLVIASTTALAFPCIALPVTQRVIARTFSAICWPDSCACSRSS
jgi:hypothetical protein